MAVKVQFFPLDVDCNEEGTFRLFGRTLDGKRLVVYDKSLEPSFWVLPKKNIKDVQEKLEEIEIIEKEDTFKVTKTEIQKKNFLGQEFEAIKVTVNEPRSIKVIGKVIENLGLETKEADIEIVKKYLVEKNIIPLTLSEVNGEVENAEGVDFSIKGEVKQVNGEFFTNPRIMAVDIETYKPIVSDDQMKKDPILMIAFKAKDFEKVITWKKFKAPDYVEIVNSESNLIQKFKEIIEDYKPDYMVGYFSDGFDFPYIKARADKYNIRLNVGLDKSAVRFRRSPVWGSTAKIKGIVHLDLFKFIRRVLAGPLQLDSYSLDFVSEELLGEGKHDVDIKNISETWDKGGDLTEFCKYNLHDANLTLRLCEKLLPNLNELVKLIGMPLFDICRMGYGQLVENYLIRRAKEFNEIVPNRPDYGKVAERRMRTYQGAFVMEPRIGLYNNIVVFDYRSLYVSIIISKNIDPGTLTTSKRGYKSPEIIDESGNKVHYKFNFKKDGFIPLVLKDLILRRNRVKEMIKKEPSAALEARSYALKTVGNATYGMLAFFGARYYSRECAASITAWGREYIKTTIEKAEGEGFEVIYSDTDSLAINLGDKKTKEDARIFLKEVNRELPSLMELELEDFYPRGIFVSKKGGTQGAKKKYALIDKNGDIKVRGFETVRKDWSLIARETQMKVIGLILKEGDYKNALTYVHDIINKIKNKEVPLEKMVISVQLKIDLDSYRQIGPHVSVAKKLREKGVDVKTGSTINFIIDEGPGLIRDKAKPLEDCKGYDPIYYIENQIIPAVEKIFEVFGIKKDQLLVKEQSRLGEF